MSSFLRRASNNCFIIASVVDLVVHVCAPFSGWYGYIIMGTAEICMCRGRGHVVFHSRARTFSIFESHIVVRQHFFVCRRLFLLKSSCAPDTERQISHPKVTYWCARWLFLGATDPCSRWLVPVWLWSCSHSCLMIM